MELKRLVMQRPAWLCYGSEDNDEQIVLSSEVSLKRNMDTYPFPEKASLKEKDEIFTCISSAVTDQKIFGDEPLVINFNDVSEIAKTLLFERDFATLGMFNGNGSRGVLFSDRDLVAQINGENHLSLSKFVNSGSVEEAWKELDEVDTLLGREITYAFDTSVGFLLNRPDQCGTGLTVSYTLHLPGLVYTETLEQVLSGAAQLGLVGSGKFNAGSESWGSLFTLTGGEFLGKTEAEILENSQKAIEDIVTAEIEARDLLFIDAFDEFEDKVWRSFGVLKYARMLSIPQLLNLTSTLRLGIERGMDIDGLTVHSIEAIVSASLQGNVAILLNGEVKESTELDIRRAEIVRSIIAA